MAISANTCVEVQYGVGSDTANGGGFDPSATAGMATDLAATTATGSSPVVTSASYTFVSGDVGALLFIGAGTNWTPGWYPIASVAGGNATLSAGVGAATLCVNNGPTTLNTVAGCATTASPTAGTWSVDYSVLAAPKYSYTDMVIGGTNTTFTSAGNPVAPNIVGNMFVITSGTNFTTGYYEVLSTSGTTATCDRALGTAAATGGHAGLGGCLNSPGGAVTATATTSLSGVVYIKNTSTITISARASVQGIVVGYSTNRWPGNTDTKPTIDAGAGSISVFYLGSSCTVRNLAFTNSGGNSSVTAIQADNSTMMIHDCTVDGYSTGIYLSFGTTIVTNCYVSNARASGVGINCAASYAVNLSGIEVRGNSNTGVTGIILGVAAALSNFIVSNVTGVGVSVSNNVLLNQGTVYGCGSHGVDLNGSFMSGVANTHSEGNGGYGFNSSNTSFARSQRLINCSGYNNTSGNFHAGFSSNPLGLFGCVACTASALNNTTGYDFSLNSTAGGGPLLESVAFPVVYPGGATSNYHDIGAAQHLAAGGGGGVATPFMRSLGG